MREDGKEEADKGWKADKMEARRDKWEQEGMCNVRKDRKRKGGKDRKEYIPVTN